ncbi:MAG: DUF983 domain-containing protein [Pseudomonadota bacterium]
MEERKYPEQSPFAVGFAGRCPRCGEGQFFDGFLSVKDRCRVCGLDYSFANSGDGPAFFIILIVGFIVSAGFLFVELSFQPPYWVHVVLWLPLTLILSLGLLRPLKGVMVALQYKNKAAEGTLDG